MEDDVDVIELHARNDDDVLCVYAGIMAILFCGIVMSHYTHLNLSPVTQITTQLTFRTIAFIAGLHSRCLYN